MEIKELKHYKHFLSQCYRTDIELLEKWHIQAPDTLSPCVNRTVNDFKGASEFKFNSLFKDNKAIGYFGSETFNNYKFMTGFFIKPNYRTNFVKKEFWETVDWYFGNKEYFMTIFAKNIPATKFLEKNCEFVESGTLERNVYLIYKRIPSCQ